MTDQQEVEARGGYWLETQSAEYDLVKYHLITATQTLGTVEKLSVWKIINPEVQYKFERKSSGMLRLHSFYDAEHCVGVNSLENVCTHGFQVDPVDPGIIVPVGIVPPLGDLQQPKECCYVMLDVAVGRSFVFDGTDSETPIPHGYDSLYVPDQPLDRNKDGKFSLQEYQNAANFDFRSSSGYRHKYLISDPSQVHPKYILRFLLQKARSGKIFLDMDVEDAEFVDPISLQPSGAQDAKVVGASSFEKRLVNVEAAYAQALEDVSKLRADPTSAAKTQWVGKQLGIIEDKVRDINLNYAEVSETIEQAAAAAQRKLQDLVKQKLELCLSMEIELRRQTEQVEWLDGVLTSELRRVQTGIAETTSAAVKRRLMLRFLKLWKQHSLHRNALSRAKPFELQALSSLHPDLRVQPDIKVFVDPFFSKDGSAVPIGAKKEAVVDDEDEDAQDGQVRDFSARASEHNYFNTPFQSSHPYLTPAIRSVIDLEMNSIHQQLSVMSKQGSLPLPPSITGVATNGSLHAPLLSMHAVLDLVRSLPSAKDQPAIVFETGAQVQEAFVSAVADSNSKPTGVADADSPKSLGGSFAVPPTPKRAASKESTTILEANIAALNVNANASPRAAPLAAADLATPSKPTPAPSAAEQKRDDASVAGSVVGGSIAGSVPMSHHPSNAPRSESKGEFDDVSMTIAQLKQVVRPFQSLTLSEVSAKKLKQLQVRLSAGVEAQGQKLLAPSRILRGEEELTNLYYSLPFFSRAPILQLIYSTNNHPRSLEELFSRTMKNRTPTLLLIRSGEHRFGAYLSHPPLPTCNWSGSPACFLFSLTLNMKVPYHARQVSAEHKLAEPMALFAQDDRIFVGDGDLTIDANLATGTSEIENCYGLGLDAESPEAMCLMAGAPVFDIDELEVWSITP
eukprot:gene28443-34337_t